MAATGALILKAGDVSPAAEQPYDQDNYKDNSKYSPTL